MSMKPKALTAFFSTLSNVYNCLYHVEKVVATDRNDAHEVILRFTEAYHAHEFAIIVDDLIFAKKREEKQ